MLTITQQKEFSAEDFDSPVLAGKQQIPTCYQGQEIKSPKELANGDRVYDVTYRRECVVVKRYQFSVKLSWTDTKGQSHTYGSSLHPLRRQA
jgi:hypothetical protein